ncbi:GntR family transcriptional regulator [Agrobacterium rhizogenes]|nr:GntR family transcriptional regulator [Rhizobium rhizogenes]
MTKSKEPHMAKSKSSDVKLPRYSLAAQVAEQVRNGVLDGTFPLGSQLNEADLAERFGVSRGPVREALARLVQEGLANSLPHRGVFVPDLTESDVIDIYLVRQPLELTAMEKVMARQERRMPLHKELSAIANRMERARMSRNWPLIAELDMQFHRTLVEAAESPRLSRVYATVQAETKLCLHKLMGGYSGNDALVQEHQLLADLMLSGTLEAALAELRRHFGNPVETMRKAIQARKDVASAA